MKRISVMFFAFFLFASVFMAESFVDYRDYVMEDSYDDAFVLAEILGKGVILIFSLPGCGNCEDLKNYTLSNGDVMDFITGKYIVTTVDKNEELMGFFPPDYSSSKYRMQYDYDALYDMYEIRLTPTMIFFNSSFERIGRIEGYLPSQSMMESIRMISEGFEIQKENVCVISQREFDIINKYKHQYGLLPLKELLENKNYDENAIYVAERSDEPFLKTTVEKYPSITILVPDADRFENTISNTRTTENKSTPAVPSAEAVVGRSEPEQSQTVNVYQAKALIAENEKNGNFMILDLRTPQEFECGHLENALNLDFFSSEFENTLKKLSKDRIYLIYCKSGGRSSKAYTEMIRLGFKKVYHMYQGYEGWINN